MKDSDDSHTTAGIDKLISFSVCVIPDLFFLFPYDHLQCVSALVQPLGVCAEYLNSSLVQVSYLSCSHVHTHT